MTSAKGLPAAVKRAYLAPYHDYRSRIAIAGFVKDIPTDTQHPSYKTLRQIEEELATLQVPTLLLWGAKDFCFHLGFLKRWQQIYPHAHTVLFPNAGHYVLEDEPAAAVNEIRKFLLKSANKSVVE